MLCCVGLPTIGGKLSDLEKIPKPTRPSLLLSWLIVAAAAEVRSARVAIRLLLTYELSGFTCAGICGGTLVPRESLV